MIINETLQQIILTTNKNHRGRPTTETEWKQDQKRAVITFWRNHYIGDITVIVMWQSKTSQQSTS